MKRAEFVKFLEDNKETIKKIKDEASELHDKVCNQKYGDNKPYSFHLCMVADAAMDFGHLICSDMSHIIPIIFGAYFHDAIEDARMTYNDIMRLSKRFMNDEQSLMATEIVYALTDEKGRNRAERGSEKHYKDIRNTKYAPFVKWCDRYANLTYSIEVDSRMAMVYSKEYEIFFKRLGEYRFVPKEIWDYMPLAA